MRLISAKGYNVFITENSWLSTDYGKVFQDFLRLKCDIHAVIDSDYKYFETADINTVITLFRNKQLAAKNRLISFFHCHGSLKDYPCDTFCKFPSNNVTVKKFKNDDALIVSNKWSVVASADEKLLRILERLFSIQSESLSKRVSIGQGLNITKSNIIYTDSDGLVPYYTSDMGPTYSWEGSNCFVKQEIASNSRQKPLLILPRGLGTHFCSVNNCNGFTSSYVEIYGELSDLEKLSIWLYCNSSLLWLLREITGRTNLGGGMLKAEATDLRAIPLAFTFNAESVDAIYTKLRRKAPSTDILVTLNSSEHQSIDNIVLNEIGLSNEREYIVNSLINRVFGRMKKSQSK